MLSFKIKKKVWNPYFDLKSFMKKMKTIWMGDENF